MIDKKRIIKLTQQLIHIPSENPPGNECKIASFVKLFLEGLGLRPKIYRFKKNRSNVVAVLKGSTRNYSLLVSPHMDTVPAGSNWKFPPFGAILRNGKIYGRGASDDKGNLAVLLEVIRSLVERGRDLDYNLIFAATADEETGSTLGLIPLLEKGILRPNDKPWVTLKPGAGPRHFTFHPDGKFAYVINELDSTVTAFQYNPTKGTLKEIQTVSTLPEDYTGINYCADIHIHPSGKYLYGSNRGHNSIAIFTINNETGILTTIGHEPTQGDFPRNFALDPSGKFLLVANQRSNNIISFRINDETGDLSPTGYNIEIPKPVCIKFLN